MGEETSLDDRGRITIRREFREHLGERVVQILTPHGVLLSPVPDELEDAEALPDAQSTSGEQEAMDEARR